jgi:hypothetical protein
LRTCWIPLALRRLDQREAPQRGIAKQQKDAKDVKYAIYEDAVTHRFALIQLPPMFIDGDDVPILPEDRWFDSREEAVAALPDLLNLEM